MSDQQKGLIESFNEVNLRNPHRFCVKHMYENFKKQFKNLEYKQLLWRAASAGTMKSWEHNMAMLKAADEQAYDWVMAHDPKTWARSHFSTEVKSDALQNNICESFNSYLRTPRDMHILSMFEWIRRRLMKRFHIKYTAMQKYIGKICPNAQDLLEKTKYESRNCVCIAAGENRYEVDYYSSSHTVDLNLRTCSCRRWDLSGMPCKHAVAAINANRQQPEDFVHQYYSKATYMAVYKHVFQPIPSKEEWERTELPDIVPNKVRKPAGRPKKKKVKAAGEPKNPHRVSRAGGNVKCGNCGALGHNVIGCKAGLTGETAWQRRVRLQGKPKRKNEASTSRGKKMAASSRGNKAAPSLGLNMDEPVSRKRTRLNNSQPNAVPLPTNDTPARQFMSQPPTATPKAAPNASPQPFAIHAGRPLHRQQTYKAPRASTAGQGSKIGKQTPRKKVWRF